MERKLKDALDGVALDEAIKEATRELNHRKTFVIRYFLLLRSKVFFSRLGGSLSGGSAIYDSLLRVGKQKKLCTVCDRHLSDQELVVFEKHVGFLISEI